MKKIYLIFIVSIFFYGILSAQNNREKKDTKEATELKVVDTKFLLDLDTIINKYQKCQNFDELHPWEIFIESVKNYLDKEIKSFYISQSFYKDAPLEGYGYFYYRNILFMVNGEKESNVFQMTNNSKVFDVYNEIPAMIFDPPRAQYYYIDEKFIFLYISPCGG